MKTTIRIIGGGIVVAAFAIFWSWEGILPGPLKTAREIAERILNQSYFRIGNLSVTPLFVLKAAIFLFLLAIAARVSRRVMRDRILVRTSIDEGLQYALAVGTGYLIFFVGLTIGLQSLGLNLSSLAFLVAQSASESASACSPSSTTLSPD